MSSSRGLWHGGRPDTAAWAALMGSGGAVGDPLRVSTCAQAALVCPQQQTRQAEDALATQASGQQAQVEDACLERATGPPDVTVSGCAGRNPPPEGHATRQAAASRDPMPAPLPSPGAITDLCRRHHAPPWTACATIDYCILLLRWPPPLPNKRTCRASRDGDAPRERETGNATPTLETRRETGERIACPLCCRRAARSRPQPRPQHTNASTLLPISKHPSAPSRSRGLGLI
jgi:hypothetical protein